MILVYIFFASFTLGFSGAIMPGPLLTATISRSARGGFWVGPTIILGHAMLELIVVIGVCYGLQSWLGSKWVLGSVGLCGGVLLGYLGFSMIRDARHLSLETAQTAGASAAGSLMTGVLTSLANPYWTIWWALAGIAALSTAHEQAAQDMPDVSFALVGSVFFVGHILSDFVWYSIVSFFISRATRVGSEKKLISDRAYRGLIVCCGVLLIAFAVYFGWSGARWLGGAAMPNMGSSG